MSVVREAAGVVRRLFASPEEELSRWQIAARGAMRLTWRCGVQMVEDRAPQMAAALAYRTIFGLIPTLVLAVVVLKFFYGADALTGPLDRFLDFIGLQELAVGEGEAGAADWIQQLVQRVSEINFTAIGAVGVLLLVYAAISLVIQVEGAFNTVYDAPRRRRLITRLTTAWTILTLGPLGVAGSFYVADRMRDAVETLGGGGVISATGAVISFAISWLILLVGYIIVPNARVHLRPALTGAFVGALLWELGKWAFAAYVDFSTGYARFYGSLGLVPLFLLWVHLTWLVILFGLEVSYAMQTLRTGALTSSKRVPAEGALDPDIVVSLLAFAAHRFNDGRTVTVTETAEEMALPGEVAARVLERLVRAEMLRRVETDDDDVTAYTLARPPSQIRLAEAIQAIEGLRLRPRDDAARRMMSRLAETRSETLGDRTLADLLD